MDYEKLFPGRFLKSADFDGKDVTLTVASVKTEELESQKGMQVKAIVFFVETKRQLVLNRTNAEAVVLCFGRVVEDWIGKRITFYPAVIKDPFGDGEISAIRVRGSPDIEKPSSATVQRGRKTIRVSVQPTGSKKAPDKKPKNGATPAEVSKEEAEEILAKERAHAAAEKGDAFPS